jgi:receptor protein-tyrosine kinase/non-specific protein-tyrosine kinase
MSRIQQILDKAEREGRVHRTAGVPGEAIPADAAVRPSSAAPSPSLPTPRVTPAATPASRPDAAAALPPVAPAAVPRVSTALPNPVTRPTRVAEGRLNRVLVTALDPHSPAAEQYRAVRTRIAQSENGRYYRALLVTSPAAGDGKSVTALNLALAMAQEFHREVLLIDADLRDPSLHRLVGIPNRPGLSDVLMGEATLEDAMVSLPDYRLTVIPAGSAVDRPTELLGSAEMRRLVDALRTQFDRIIFDTPPAAPLADVGVLSPLVDGLLLVVRAGRTQRPAIDRALEDIDPARLIGLLLNDVEQPVTEYAYGRDAASADGGRRGSRRKGRASA